jgi:ATP-dependent DNA helicase RecQ
LNTFTAVLATYPTPPIATPTHNAACEPLQVLHDIFGYSAFREMQGQVVEHVTRGQDALVLMPTGGGKSLCYQVPAIARHRAQQGATLVISPLIALMQDQVDTLIELGVNAAYLNSTQDYQQSKSIEREWLNGQLVLLYVAPERLLTPRFLSLLDSMYQRGLLSLFAIDEAHCVSQWGHDFREDYLGLAQLHERYPLVPRMALTATADRHTREDILQRLQLQDARQFISSFDRPNIHYTIVEKTEPRQQLLKFILQSHRRHCGIVYCASRKKVEDTAAWLVSQGIPSLPYHAGLDLALRQRHQESFVQHDSADGGLVMVATIAFGMGIDKPDVRFVAHLDLPRSMESYYQETGRAGRDGAPAQAWMAYGLNDIMTHRRMIDDGEAHDSFKHLQRQRLDSMLALAETAQCRRQQMLAYFDEMSKPCGHCDNCLNPPEVWDATEPARMALSAVYRMARHSRGSAPTHFGAAHLVDVLRGKRTTKVLQYQHQALPTFGVGQAYSEVQWRSILRQLVAAGHLVGDAGEFPVLHLQTSAREVLKGQTSVFMKRSALKKATAPQAQGTASSAHGNSVRNAQALLDSFDAAARKRYKLLKEWRRELAQKMNKPAYVIFHDLSLAEMAQFAPKNLNDLALINGMGSRKLEAYGQELLSLLRPS